MTTQQQKMLKEVLANPFATWNGGPGMDDEFELIGKGAAVIREMLEAWEDQFGVGACDCRPEPENRGHVCAACKARLFLGEVSHGD